nr:MAG TPA: hypothetical protein [Caudoviricetes sp.]
MNRIVYLLHRHLNLYSLHLSKHLLPYLIYYRL